ALHNIRSDDAHLGSNDGDYAAAGPIYDNFNYSLDHWLVNGYWSGHFGVINLANNVLAAADSLNNLSDGRLTNIGEAKHMRAWAYFNIVRTFSLVPIIVFRITDQAPSNKPQTTVPHKNQVIASNFPDAVSYLPDSLVGFPGRLTRGTALSLQTKNL